MIVSIRGACIAAAVALAATGMARAQPVRYDKHRVVRVLAPDDRSVDRLLNLTDDVWSESVGPGPLTVRVSPEQYDRLAVSGLRYEILIQDIQAILDAQAAAPRGAGPYDNYRPYDDVLAHLTALAAQRPDLARLFVIGQTVEGRDIIGIRITGPGTGTKPAVFYHGCSHAREWITIPVTLFVADRLVNSYDSDPAVRALVDRVEWLLAPVFNADGYVYTWTSERFWRKNRRNNGNGTFGVDLNRNWGFAWGGSGSSGSPSSDIYRGTGPFSEPETQAIRDFMLDHPNIVAYNDLHSYGQHVMWPWGHQPLYTPDDAEMRLVGNAMASRIRSVHGRIYTTGTPPEILYAASGTSIDWVYSALGALAYTFELRDTGPYGFVLPPAQILPTCEENWPPLLHLADWASAAVRIELTYGVPETLLPGQPTPLTVRVIAAREAVDPASVRLVVRRGPAAAWIEYPAAPIGNDEFTAEIPAMNCDDRPRFYIRAVGQAGGEVTSPLGAPDLAYSAGIGDGFATLLADNFEQDNGWTVVNDPTLSSGAWVRVNPIGTFDGGQPVQPEDDNPAGTGTMCYVTGQGTAGGSTTQADVDGGPTWLISPLLALGSLNDPVIGFFRWVYSSRDEMLMVEVSNDAGATWMRVDTIYHQPSWEFSRFRVAAFVTPTDAVRVRFGMADEPSNGISEAAIDDFEVSDLDCTAVPLAGDVNCDGSVDAADAPALALALIDPAAFAAAYPDCELARADIDGDGEATGGDVQAFADILVGWP